MLTAPWTEQALYLAYRFTDFLLLGGIEDPALLALAFC